MEDKYLLAINSMTQEQYNKYFKHLPIPYSTIKSNPKKFIKILASDNELLSQLMNDFLKNNIQIVNILSKSSNYEFCIYIDTNNQTEKNFAKQIREKLNLDSTQFSLSSAGNGIVQLNVSVKELKGVLDFKNLVENYFSVNKNKSDITYDELNVEVLNNILQQYSNIPQEVIEKVLEENQKEIAHLVEKGKEKNNFVNPNINNQEYAGILLENSVDLKYIHSMDSVYKKIPFSELTEDMKRTMCNKYCQALINSKLNILQNELSKQSKTDIKFLFHQQTQKDLSNYGIAGNTRPFDEQNNITTIDIFSNNGLQYFKLDDGKVSLNEELLGQVMITILHEYRHSQQQKAIRDGVQNNPLLDAIKDFELKCEDKSDYYIENYKNDPAEIDAIFYSFAQFKRIAMQYGIQDADKIIMNKVKGIRNNADETMRVFDMEFNSYSDVMTFLETKLQSQFKSKQEINIPNSESQAGYSREESGTSVTERQQQVLKDYSGQEIGHRTITSTYDMEKGTELIDTVGEIENKDGTYKISDKQQVYGGELQLQRKEITRFNKLTGENEQYVYQKDKNGNELYYRVAEGKLTFKITKNARGTTMEQYDRGQIINTFEYDENGVALMGMEGIDTLDENYISNFFEANIPYFEAENSDLQMQQTTVDTKKLGKETLDLQNGDKKMDDVESVLEEHRAERQQPTQQQQTVDSQTNEFGEKNGAEEKSFRDRMRVEVDSNEYAQEVLTRIEEDLEQGTLDKGKKKKQEDYNPEKGDDDYVL